jgi:glycosyltransferase involved in cell wall biosynthesis
MARVAGPPLVSIGIPTYNRRESLERTVRSALAQDHSALEVVVSDDASTDDTEALMRGLTTAEPRLRYLRQRRNVGHALNFQAVLDAARGEYFMWLTDDDWLDPSYVSQCLAELTEHPDHSLVCGLARYHSNGRHVVDERPTNLQSGRPAGRVLSYLARVNVNGALYGIARRDELRRVAFQDVLGGDWLLVAGMAARGRVRTLPAVHIHRSLDGLSSDERKLAESFGVGGVLARRHHFLVATRFAREILRSPVYAGLGPRRRAITAALAMALIVLRFPGHAAVRWVLQGLGLGALEQRAIAWVRSRD